MLEAAGGLRLPRSLALDAPGDPERLRRGLPMADDALMFLPFSTASGGVTPDLAGGRSGLLRGDAGLVASGQDGSGLSLSGGGHVEVAHDAGFDLAAGALSFWLRPDAIGVTQGLVGKDSRGIDAGEISVLLRADGRISFRLESEDRTYQALSSRALEAGDWAHVEVAWGDDGMQIRLDGVLDGTSSYAGGLSGNDEPWVIGANAVNSAAGGATGLGGFFRGQIDEVTLSGQGGATPPPPPPPPSPAPTGLKLSFAGQADRAKDVDLQRGFWTDAVRVMPLGDSNTRGERGTPDSALDVGYRGFLWSHITAAGGFVDFVGGAASGPATLPDRDHQGVGGIKASVVKTLAEDHARAHHPDVVLLMLGTNDIKFSAAATRTVPEDLLSIMQSIEKVEPDVTILLAELPPIDPSAPGYKYLASAAAARETINAGLPDLIARAQALGIDARLAPASGLTTSDLFDGIHPGPDGYAKLADAWFAALESGLASGAFGGARHGTAGVQNLHGSELGDRLRGDDGDNRIFGRKGADVIEGGDGDDLLSGGGGGDVFLWRTADQGADVITDFRAEDFIQVFAAGFGGGLEGGDAALLRSGANPAPQGGAGQFLYDRDDGGLFWDADGAGAEDALLFATLKGAPALDADQVLIA
jgi:serralysin